MKTLKILNYLIGLLFLTSSLFGCVSPMHKAVNDVHPGMDKSDVLEVLGSPKYSTRSKGMDVWQYVFYKDNTKMTKTLYFQFGSILKVGKTVVRPDLLKQAMASSNSIDEYENNIQNYLDNTKQNSNAQ